MAIRLVISGCCGRMGSRIATLALPWYNNPPLEIAGAIEAKGHPAIGRDLGEVLEEKTLGVRITDDPVQALKGGDVLIEFTRPEATRTHLEVAKKLGKAVVIGTTGLQDGDRQLIAASSKSIPIVFSPNMSVGVNLLFELAQLAAERLGPSYGVDISEAHHKDKKDAPSGTAKRLQEVIANIRDRWHLDRRIPCESIRQGDIVGNHTVVFSGKFETLALTHEALDRDVFALGALKAAQFIASQPPGLYDMSDVLKADRHG